MPCLSTFTPSTAVPVCRTPNARGHAPARVDLGSVWSIWSEPCCRDGQPSAIFSCALLHVVVDRQHALRENQLQRSSARSSSPQAKKMQRGIELITINKLQQKAVHNMQLGRPEAVARFISGSHLGWFKLGAPAAGGRLESWAPGPPSPPCLRSGCQLSFPWSLRPPTRSTALCCGPPWMHPWHRPRALLRPASCASFISSACPFVSATRTPCP